MAAQCKDLDFTERACARCVYARGVLRSHTKLSKHDERVILKVCNSRFSQKEIRFNTAYMRVRDQKQLERPTIVGYERLSRHMVKFSLIMN